MLTDQSGCLELLIFLVIYSFQNRRISLKSFFWQSSNFRQDILRISCFPSNWISLKSSQTHPRSSLYFTLFKMVNLGNLLQNLSKIPVFFQKFMVKLGNSRFQVPIFTSSISFICTLWTIWEQNQENLKFFSGIFLIQWTIWEQMSILCYYYMWI